MPNRELDRRRAFMKSLIVKLKRDKEAILREFCLTQSCSRRLAIETYNLMQPSYKKLG